MLSAENLTCRRGGRSALESLDLHVAPREIVALVGPEQAGKTTALECFLGRHVFTSGRVTIDGLPASVSGSLLAYIPAQLPFPAEARVLSYTRDSCLRLGRKIPDAVLCATLQRNGVPAFYHHGRIGDCTPAMRCHLALALAWLCNAPALLIDEPNRDLAPIDLEALVTNLRGLRKADRAILLATRDLAFAQRIATRIVMLDRGATVESFDPNASRRMYQAHSFLAELVG